MVLPESAADAGGAQAWASAALHSIKRLFTRSKRAVLILMHPAVPTRLGEVVRFFSDAPPWQTEGEVMRVCLRAADLDDVPEGGHMLLRLRAEELPLLNVVRPYFVERRPRAVFWVDEETFEPLRTRAPDLFSFIFRLVEVPPRRWPEFAVQGVKAALEAGVPWAWDGERWELEGLLGEAGHAAGTVELRTSMSFREMLRALERPGLPVVLGMEREVDPWRVRMALARAGREGAWVALQPTKVPPGMWRLHARRADLDEATARLREAGWEQAGAMAAWVDLEPERIEEAAGRVGQPPVEPRQWPAERVAVGDGPMHVLRARIRDADVVATRNDIRRGPAPVDAGSVAVWSEGAEPWRDDAEGPIDARLVRSLRCLGDASPAPGSVDAAARAGLPDVAAELGRLAFERGMFLRADEVLERLAQQGEVALALGVAEQWYRRAQAAGDERSLSVASTWLGDLHGALGHGEQALRCYEDGLGITRMLVEREPARAELQRDLSVSWERLGDLHFRMGDSERARHCYEEGLSIAKMLVAQAPGRWALQRDLSVSWNELGDLHVALGNVEQARRAYEEGLAIRRALLDRGPGGSEALRDLSVSLNKLGDLHVGVGDVEQARACYEESLAIRRLLVEREPVSSEARRDLSVSCERLGDLYFEGGDAERALQCYEEGMAIARALVEREPDRVGLQRDLSVSYNKLGDVYLAVGNVEQARRCYEDGLAIRRMLAARESERLDLQRDLSVSYDRLGDVQRALGNADEARRWYDQSLAIRRVLAQREPERSDLQRDLAVCLVRLAATTPGDAELRREAIVRLRDLHARGVLDARYVPLLDGLAGDAG